LDIFSNKDAILARELRVDVSEISDSHAQALAKFLENDTYFTTLDLSKSYISTNGIQYIATALQKNTVITTLLLKSTLVDTIDIVSTIEPKLVCIANMLQQNHTIKILNISDNTLRDSDLKILANAVIENDTIEFLILSDNLFFSEGLAFLSDALKINYSIKTLDLQNSLFGDHGVQHLADALNINKTITSINLSNSLLTDKSIMHLSKCLKNNKKITALYLANNTNSGTGVDSLITALNENYVLEKTLLTACTPKQQRQLDEMFEPKNRTLRKYTNMLFSVYERENYNFSEYVSAQITTNNIVTMQSTPEKPGFLNCYFKFT
jgi:Ran GTPase-activating protein (RanGAP) involved in mRNA processing and transport